MLLGDLPDLLPLIPRRLEREFHIAARGEPGQKRVGLEDNAAVQPWSRHRRTIDGDTPGLVIQQPRDDGEQGALATARDTNKRNEFILRQRQVYISQCLIFVEVLAEGLNTQFRLHQFWPFA